MALIPEDDTAALAELLGYLGEIGYGDLYLKSRPGAGSPAAGGVVGIVAVVPAGAAGSAAGTNAVGSGAGLGASGAGTGAGATGSGAGAGVGLGGDREAIQAIGSLASAARSALAAGPGYGAPSSAAGMAVLGSGGVSAGPAAEMAAASPGAEESPAAPPAAPNAAPEPMAVQAALAAIAEQVAACRRCRLSEGRHLTVFGSGDPQAELMFIGEGPGAEEDRQGLPFVGRAGELLTKIIEAIDLRRDQVYIANIVKCRPPGNRDPQPDEVAACRPYLERQIGLIRPRFLVALGRIAAQTLLANDLPIGRMRGQWFSVFGVPTMVTYHPAALLRNPALKRPTWEDMQQVRDRLQEKPGSNS